MTEIQEIQPVEDFIEIDNNNFNNFDEKIKNINEHIEPEQKNTSKKSILINLLFISGFTMLFLMRIIAIIHDVTNFLFMMNEFIFN
ncbi:MAG: hypothetical protein GY870_04315 [archaeon]|nr:hypothetical protein [archaeon]